MGNITSADFHVLYSIGFLNVKNTVKKLRHNNLHNIFNNKSPHFKQGNFSMIKDCYNY